jgi:hypothetical protein
VDRANTPGMGIPRTLRFTGTGVLALALLCLVVPTAGASIVTASNSMTIGPGMSKPVAASCPVGSDPLTAGFSISGFDTVEGGIVPTRSQRTADGSIAKGENYSSVATGTLTDYAYCDTDSRAIVVRAANVTLPQDLRRTATATCPEGTKVVSGGYVTTPSAGGGLGTVFTYRSRKVQNGWRASAFNVESDPAALKALAYCQQAGPNLQAGTESAMTNPAQYHGLATVTPTCPPSTRPVSGGFDGHYVTTPSQNGVAPLTSRRIAGGWAVTGWSLSATVDAQLTGFVYCEPT